jgi:hypothetical protein
VARDQNNDQFYDVKFGEYTGKFHYSHLRSLSIKNAKEAQMNEQNEKELMIVEYIKSIKALEDAMEPYKDQRRELRKEYQDNGWLSRDEIRVAVKAYRLMRSGDDLDDLYDMYSLLAKARAGGMPSAT